MNFERSTSRAKRPDNLELSFSRQAPIIEQLGKQCGGAQAKAAAGCKKNFATG